MRKQKFWCHYLAQNGNDPKRRKIELAYFDIAPDFDNSKSVTPIWYLKNKPDNYGYVRYDIYAQISNEVAVCIFSCNKFAIEKVCETDEQISERHDKLLEKFLSERPDMSEALKEKEREYRLSCKRDDYLSKGNYIARLVQVSNFTHYLLNYSDWIPIHAIKAYEEIQSPNIQQLMHRRDELFRQRELESEERRKRQEMKELERKRREDEARVNEEKRLDGEEAHFKKGGEITAHDLISLCKRHNISINPRTHHTIETHIGTITGKGYCQYYKQRGKRSPSLRGTMTVAACLFNLLNEK